MINIEKFCDKKNRGSFSLTQPCYFDGFVFASDGRIAIKVKTKKSENIINNFPIEKTIEIIEKAKRGTDVDIVLPDDAENTIKETCSNCKGSGFASECSECDEGIVTCFECGHETSCDNCNGSGVIRATSGHTCSVCSGAGKVDKYFPVALNDEVFVQLKYLILIKNEIGEIKFKVNGPEDPVYFSFPKGEGILMPCRQEHTKG